MRFGKMTSAVLAERWPGETNHDYVEPPLQPKERIQYKLEMMLSQRNYGTDEHLKNNLDANDYVSIGALLRFDEMEAVRSQLGQSEKEFYRIALRAIERSKNLQMNDERTKLKNSRVQIWKCGKCETKNSGYIKTCCKTRMANQDLDEKAAEADGLQSPPEDDDSDHALTSEWDKKYEADILDYVVYDPRDLHYEKRPRDTRRETVAFPYRAQKSGTWSIPGCLTKMEILDTSVRFMGELWKGKLKVQSPRIYNYKQLEKCLLGMVDSLHKDIIRVIQGYATIDKIFILRVEQRQFIYTSTKLTKAVYLHFDEAYDDLWNDFVSKLDECYGTYAENTQYVLSLTRYAIQEVVLESCMNPMDNDIVEECLEETMKKMIHFFT